MPSLHNPKSAIFTYPSVSSNKLSNFKSLRIIKIDIFSSHYTHRSIVALPINDIIFVQILKSRYNAGSIKHSSRLRKYISVDVHHKITTGSVFHHETNMSLKRNPYIQYPSAQSHRRSPLHLLLFDSTRINWLKTDASLHSPPGIFSSLIAAILLHLERWYHLSLTLWWRNTRRYVCTCKVSPAKEPHRIINYPSFHIQALKFLPTFPKCPLPRTLNKWKSFIDIPADWVIFLWPSRWSNDSIMDAVSNNGGCGNKFQES